MTGSPKGPNVVELSDADVQRANKVTALRLRAVGLTSESDRAAGYRRRCEAELAVSQVLGLPWRERIERGEADFEPNINVRVRFHSHRAWNVWDDESGNQVLVLVTNVGGSRYRVDGWMPVAEIRGNGTRVRVPGPRGERIGVSIAPEDGLHPISDLRAAMV